MDIDALDPCCPYCGQNMKRITRDRFAEPRRLNFECFSCSVALAVPIGAKVLEMPRAPVGNG